MGSESLDEVGTILRSILTSEKNGIPLRKLDGEYRMVTGSRIPYRKFGFNTMEEYLESIPDTIRLARGFDGETLVHVVVTESTAHVAQMVRGQKSTKPKAAVRSMYRRPMAQHQPAYRPNRILSKYSSNYKTPGSDEKRRPGYQIYRPPPQRAAQQAAQQAAVHQQGSSTAFGWPRKEPTAATRSSGGDRAESKPSSSFGGGFQRSSSFEKPPRFLKPSQQSSSSSLGNDEPAGGGGPRVQARPATAAPVPPRDQPVQNGGWRQLDSSWSGSTPPPANASGTTQGVTGGGGDGAVATHGWGAATAEKPAAAKADTRTATGNTGWRDDGLATDGWGEPAQPVATSTASKSLLGWNSEPQPVAKPATPVEHRPVAAIEPGQPRVDPFRLMGGLRMPWMEKATGQLPPDPAPTRLAEVEPGQQRCDQFNSTTPTKATTFASASPTEQPKVATLAGYMDRLLLPTNASKSAPLAAVEKQPCERPLERFDPFRTPLRLENIPSKPTTAAHKPQLGVNLDATPFTGLGAATPQPPVVASPKAAAPPTTFTPLLPTMTVTQPWPEPFDDPTGRHSAGALVLPGAPPAVVEVPLPSPTTPHCLLVLAYARQRGLEPLYSTMPHRSQRRLGAPTWLATLRLGDRKFPSYPNERPSPEEARDAAAARAVAELRIQALPPVHLVTPARTPDEVSALVTRIVELVVSKPCGIREEGMDAAYEGRFEEQLPPFWLEHVAESGQVQIERRGRQCILYPLQPENRPAIRRRRAMSEDKEGQEDKNQEDKEDQKDKNKNQENKEDQEDKNMNQEDKTSSASTSSGEQSRSATNFVDVFVTCVNSTDNVHFRFVAYDADFVEMMEKMTLHYGNGDNTGVPTELQEGNMYATLFEDCWIRVELVARRGNGEVECYFVDEGTTVVLEETALLHLKTEFTILPKQAIQCQLDGLLKYAASKDITEILANVLLGKSLVAEVISREDPVTVVMYDTWGPEDRDLNSEIFQRLMAARLPAKGCVATCILSYVRPDGVVWLQPNELGMREVEDFSPALDQYCQKNPNMPEKPEMDKMYACRFQEDGMFYRAVLLSPNPLPSGEFEVQFVDYGNAAKVFLAEFRNIDCLGDLVVSLPRQALKGRLRGLTGADGITWFSETADTLLGMSVNSKLVVKVCEPASGLAPALVELYKRQEPNRDLVSLNDTLLDVLRSKPPA